MVQLTKTPACIDGNHTECNGGDKAPEGVFGGQRCICECHLPSRTVKLGVKISVDDNEVCVHIPFVRSRWEDMSLKARMALFEKEALDLIHWQFAAIGG